MPSAMKTDSFRNLKLMKKIFLFPCLLLAFALGACSSDEETDMTIELASPQLKATTNVNMVTITWTEIPKTAGYAYRFDGGEYTEVGADVLKYTGAMTDGAHVFEIYAVGNKTHTTDSAVRKIEFEISLTLPSPQPKAVTVGSTTTISWDAVPNAAGYAYSVDGAAEVTVKADVLSYSSDFSGGKHTFAIRALGDGGVTSADSAVKSIEFDVVDTSNGVYAKKTSGAIVKLTEGAAGIFTTTLDCSAADSFTVLIDNAEHGFMEFSGNGCVGTVNSEYSSMPFYNTVFTGYVRESIGRLSKTGTLRPLYTNLEADGKVYLKIDCTDPDSPIYYMQLEKAADATTVLELYFDLFTYGGDWVNQNKGGTGVDKTVDALVDGTEAGTKSGATTGTKQGYTLVSSSEPGVEAYMANRGITGWAAENIYEYPGYIRLGVSKPKTSPSELFGVLTTPELNAAGNLKVTFDGLRFASEGDISVKVLGGGTIAAASVVVDGSGNPVSITPEAGNDTFLIKLAYNTKFANAAQKSWSNFTFTVENATAQTRISWDSSSAGTSSAGRYCLDNIVIKKN